MQCTIQNSPWWLTDDYTHHITWSWMNEKQTSISIKLMKAIYKQLSSIIVKIKFVCAVSNASHAIHTIRFFRYPRLILELHVIASFCLPQQLFNFPLNIWTGFYETVKEFTSIA